MKNLHIGSQIWDLEAGGGCVSSGLVPLHPSEHFPGTN